MSIPNYPSPKEFSIDFKRPADPVMQPLFNRAGLALSAEEIKHRRAHIRRLQNELVTAGGLLAMQRPVFRPDGVPYYHRDYTAAALVNAPKLYAFGNSRLWFSEANEHLQNFARQPAAKEIIGQGIATHYSRIAAAAELIPDLSPRALIRTRRQPDGITPLRLFGVTCTNVAVDDAAFYKNPSEDNRTYFGIEEIAGKVGWFIPEFGDPATQAAIRDAFAESHDPALPADPEQLFMLGHIVTERGVHLNIRKTFGLG